MAMLKTLARSGLVIGGVAAMAAGAVAAAAKEPAAPSGEMVLDLGGSGTGAGTGKVSLQDFHFSKRVDRPAEGAARGSGSSSSSVCPSSGDMARWTAPELHSSDARAAAAVMPTGPACLNVVSPRDTASGLATGKRMHKPSSSSSSSSSSSQCAKGQHIAEAHLTVKREVYTLTDITVEECSAQGMVLSFARMRHRPEMMRSASN